MDKRLVASINHLEDWRREEQLNYSHYVGMDAEYTEMLKLRGAVARCIRFIKEKENDKIQL